jgi:transcriptional regulator with XRE-family HTH domain
MAEVDPAYLVRLERGEKVSPSLVTLTKLSHALGVTIADLLGGK